MKRALSRLSAIALLLSAWTVSAPAGEPWPTRGGGDGRVIRVTSLAESGPGTLKAALDSSGPRRIVFDVAGEIWISDTLLIRNPYVTIDGENAPSPGITVIGDRIRIRAHDVIVRHIRLRVGALPGSNPDNRDGFTIDGSLDGKDPNHGVLIENCSVSWSIDEAMQVWGDNSHDIAIRDSIFAEALDRSIHPKGAHSMGPIIGPNTRNIVLQRNLMAHNRARNPVVSGGAQAIVVNNLIYNPGFNGVHFYPWQRDPQPTLAAVVGNVVIAGPSTKSVLVAFDHGIDPGSRIFYRDNLAIGTKTFDPTEKLAKGPGAGSLAPFVAEAPLSLAPAGTILPAGQVEAHVLANVGARPRDRDATDARIVAEVRARSGGVRDWPADPRLDPRSPEAARR